MSQIINCSTFYEVYAYVLNVRNVRRKIQIYRIFPEFYNMTLKAQRRRNIPIWREEQKENVSILRLS